jgi:glutamine---fructose-6-phosphate transaminase (isomerizing)
MRAATAMMTESSNMTLMEQEAREVPARIADQLRANTPLIQELCIRLQQQAPRYVMIVGRGSSDHAGVFAKYLIEIETGIPVFSAAPSVATVYGRALQLRDALVLVISQSGRSPDIVMQAQRAKIAGAYVVALVNDEQSPLAQAADFVLPLRAGPERSVAATKSYLCTLSALLQLTAHWSGNRALADALTNLPAQLSTVLSHAAQLHADQLRALDHLIVLGRGLGYATGKELALKLKEVCSVHAEAFSSAEFLHGPVALAQKALTVIDVAINDEAADAHRQQIQEVGRRGATVLSLNQTLNDCHPRLAPLLLLQRFYVDVAQAAVALGGNPDQPIGLKKVTETL